MQTAIAHSVLPDGRSPCFTNGHVTTSIELCRHQFRIGGFLPCPYCKPEDTAVLEGEGSTPVEVAEVANRRKPSANLGIQRPLRTLDLSGKTLAGCAIGRRAADATRGSRFHAIMSCGHAQIVDGSIIAVADRAGKTLKCSACIKADQRGLRAARAAAKKAGGDG
jgi:hypothetical protein